MKKDKSNKDGDFLDKILLNKWFYLVITIFFIVIFAVVFSWGRNLTFFNHGYVADSNILGTYGDFIGGVLGTIFALISTLLLVRTFTQQKRSSDKNEKQVDNQRFNDLFFELLRLYQSEISELCGMVRLDEETCLNYDNKDFFDVEKHRLQDSFVPNNSFEVNRNESLLLYMEFYIQNQAKVGACFRTLYRIYDLIDNSVLDENVKIEYLKIMRAQLTDSELFFIRYNCISYYGSKFITYVNRYNILKHLPTFELLEFKDWWSSLDEIERAGLGIVAFHGTRHIKKLLNKNQKDIVVRIPDKNSKYKFELKITGDYEVEICLTVDYGKDNHVMEYRGLDKFSPKKIQALFDCFLKEVILYSNFGRFNKEKDLEFYSNPIVSHGKIHYINSGVRNKNKQRLIVSDPEIEQKRNKASGKNNR